MLSFILIIVIFCTLAYMLLVALKEAVLRALGLRGPQRSPRRSDARGKRYSTREGEVLIRQGSAKKKKKVFNDNVGEYVEYEEVK